MGPSLLFRNNIKKSAYFFKFKKRPLRPVVAGRVEVGGGVRLIVGWGGLYGFVINPRVQLVLFLRRAAGVLI